MELKQWLYNHGDECPWNTGGWIKCAYDVAAYSGYARSWVSNGSASGNLLFSEKSIIMSGTVDTNNPISAVDQGGTNIYGRGGGVAKANVGTLKPLKISSKMYNSIQIVGSNSSINYTFRVGTINDENTSTSTPTILQSGSGESAEIKEMDSNAYIIIGKTIDYPSYDNAYSSHARQTDSFSAEITEIWME